MSRIAQIWQWFTKSRYTRSLEVRVAQLEAELQRWQNAMLETANLPSVLPREGESALPKLKKRMTPSQWRAAAERATERPQEEKKPV